MSSSALVSLKDGKPVTTSLIVAESFGKRHDNVLRDVERITKSPAYLERNQLNFEAVDYLDAKGERRPMFEMDRQGFEILAMGFTGEEALRWKFKYSDAFASMEQSLKSPAPNDLLAAQLADFLDGKVLVDYATLCAFSRMLRAGMAALSGAEQWLQDVEKIGGDLEKQCGKPLIKFDIGKQSSLPMTHRPQAKPLTATPDAESRLDQDPDVLARQVSRYVSGLSRVTVDQVIEKALGSTSTKSLQIRVGIILRSIGWERKQHTFGDRQRYYVPINRYKTNT
ncbi:MAG: Rha family transcriptional regulator [Candidatus Competibacter denitrificans]|jgi:Rha family phage regulatory protein